MNIKDVITKIQKLLALSKSDNANEAAVAAAQAQKLMDEYRISSMQLEAEDDPMVKAVPIYGDSRSRRSTWKGKLACTIGLHNGVYTVWYGGILTLTGAESDILITKYLFDFCVREIESVTKKECAGLGKTYANSFKLGCVHTIGQKLRQDREVTQSESDSNANAMVLASNRLAKAKDMYDAKETKSTFVKSNFDAMANAHGQQAAKSIQIHKGIKGGDSTSALRLGSGA